MNQDCGCVPNSSTLLVGPVGLNGTNGNDGPSFIGTSAKSRIDYSFGQGISNAINSWVTVAYPIYPGTLNLPQAITNILVIANTTSSGYIRLLSSSGIVATGSIINNGNATIIDLGTIDQTKLSNTIDMLQLQTIANGGQITAFALSLLSI